MKKQFLCILSVLCMAFVAHAQDSLRVTIFGDSYSTFFGYIPATHEPWYGPEGHAVFRGEQNDVHKVEHTWWYQLIDSMGWKLECNNSWSGSTIGYFGYQEECYKERSFITRMAYLGEPDIILVCGGTNDSWTKEKVGAYKYGNWEDVDFWYFRPAMARLLSGLREHYPMAQVYFILNNDLRDDIDESVLTICRHYGVPCIELKDIDKQLGHPSRKGMQTMAEQIIEGIKQHNK